MAKSSSPAKLFLISDAVVVVDTGFLELEVDEGVGGDGQQGDQTGNEDIAWNADGIRATFSCEAAIGGEINPKQNNDGEDVQGECNLRNTEGWSGRMCRDADDDLECAFEGRCPKENPCRVDDDEGYCAS